LLGFRQVLQAGKAYEKNHPHRFEQQLESGRADDVCALVYTAGTGGTPLKAAVHTHRTLRASAEAVLQSDPWFPRDHLVPYLPPSWITEQWFNIGCHLLSACTLNFAEAPETQQRDMRETGPSIVIYNARVWERQAAQFQSSLDSAEHLPGLVRRLCLPLGNRLADLRSRGQQPGPFLKLGYALADRIFFRPIKKRMGLARARVCYATGALLSPEAFRFYETLAIPLKSLYGSTEGGILAVTRGRESGLETGVLLQPGVAVQLSAHGELLFRQPGVFVGYYQDPQQTAAVLEAGWLHSGDYFRPGPAGDPVLIDRLSDRVALTGGEVLAPQMIEARLRFSPYIREAWVFPDPQGSTVSAVVVINYEQVSRWAGKRRVPYTALADLSQRPEVIALVQQEVRRINTNLPSGVRISRYINLHREFDPNAGELTRTGALRRSRLAVRYRELVEALNGDQTELAWEEQVQHRDGRTGTARTALHIQSLEMADL
jgi:long-chain acyl-CoA synthetase